MEPQKIETVKKKMCLRTPFISSWLCSLVMKKDHMWFLSLCIHSTLQFAKVLGVTLHLYIIPQFTKPFHIRFHI